MKYIIFGQVTSVEDINQDIAIIKIGYKKISCRKPFLEPIVPGVYVVAALGKIYVAFFQWSCLLRYTKDVCKYAEKLYNLTYATQVITSSIDILTRKDILKCAGDGTPIDD